MLNKVLAISVISLCGLSAGAMLPQSASAATGKGIVAKYDKDGDQTLDLAEVKAAASARFDQLDKDGDGTLDSAEVQGVVGQKAFKAADPDNDGKLSKDEYLALVEKSFNKVDVDHDGTLSAQELNSKSAHALKRLID
jgi:Ca2+-binding EF-hand superfamily protein